MSAEDPAPDTVTRLLAQARLEGDAGMRALFAALYQDLRRLAHRRLRAGAGITLMDTGALVHESYERLVKLDGLELRDKSHFLAYAARVMRSIVVDAARERAALRRGGDAVQVTLDTELGEALAQGHSDTEPDVVRVHEALQELAQIEPRLEQVVEMRYFGGLANAEIAGVLGIGLRTVERDWERARSFLYATMNGGAPPPA